MRWTPGFTRIANAVRAALIETIYPRTCAGCGLRGTWLCEVCDHQMVPFPETLVCHRCGHPVIAARCECRNLHPAIGRARAVGAYDGWISNAIRGLKYEGERDRASHMGGWLSEPLRQLGGATGIVPVPLHSSRMEQRGYNQALELANVLSAVSGLPVLNVLVRTQETSSQTHKSREERIENLDGVMALRAGWTPEATAHYVILDDVFTTGATVNACAEVLSNHGARMISVLAFAFDLRGTDLKRYREMLSATIVP